MAATCDWGTFRQARGEICEKNESRKWTHRSKSDVYLLAETCIFTRGDLEFFGGQSKCGSDPAERAYFPFSKMPPKGPPNGPPNETPPPPPQKFAAPPPGPNGSNPPSSFQNPTNFLDVQRASESSNFRIWNGRRARSRRTVDDPLYSSDNLSFLKNEQRLID